MKRMFFAIGLSLVLTAPGMAASASSDDYSYGTPSIATPAQLRSARGGKAGAPLACEGAASIQALATSGR